MAFCVFRQLFPRRKSFGNVRPSHGIVAKSIVRGLIVLRRIAGGALGIDIVFTIIRSDRKLE